MAIVGGVEMVRNWCTPRVGGQSGPEGDPRLQLHSVGAEAGLVAGGADRAGHGVGGPGHSLRVPLGRRLHMPAQAWFALQSGLPSQCSFLSSVGTCPLSWLLVTLTQSMAHLWLYS